LTASFSDEVFSEFVSWAIVNRFYLPPGAVDTYEWLKHHIAAEVNSNDPTHCERCLRAYFDFLPESAVTRRAILSHVFGSLLPHDAAVLRLPLEPDELKKPRRELVVARDKWLDGLNPATAYAYEFIFDEFWRFAEPRYAIPRNETMDWTNWLIEHRRLEIRNTDPKIRFHCEDILTQWVVSLRQTDLDPQSIITYARAVRSFFRHLLPRGRARLRLPRNFPVKK